MDKNEKIITEALLATKREGMEDLVSYMKEIGFFTAPCSGGFHLCQEGGLAEHTIHVMDLAQKIAETFLGKKNVTKEFRNTIIISAALHDLGKAGQFGKVNYVPNILKSGEQSKAKPYETNKELLYVDHEIRSVAIASMFIDLTEDEQFAILYHNGLYGNLKYAIKDHETPLYMIIHFADLWATKVVENEN